MSETLPEAQRTQGIESITQTIPTAEWKRNTIIYLSYINLCVVNVKCMIIISDHSFNIFCNSCTVAPCRPHCNAMHWWPHSPHWASPCHFTAPPPSKWPSTPNCPIGITKPVPMAKSFWYVKTYFTIGGKWYPISLPTYTMYIIHHTCHRSQPWSLSHQCNGCLQQSGKIG